MMNKMNAIWEESSHSRIEELVIVPQKTLYSVWKKISKLRVIVLILVAACIVLAAVAFKEREAFSRLLFLETENKAKDAVIERLQKENNDLKEKLSFQLKVDGLVAKIQKEAPWLEQERIRPVAENALSHTTDPALYLAIGLVEAELKARIVHADGVALGMHGLCPKDWHTFLKSKGIMHSRADYFDPVKSFKGSEAVLSTLVREYGSLEKALLFYNGGGPATSGMIPKSTAYMKRVLYLRKIFAV